MTETTPPVTEAPLPRTVSWFAPWTWKRRYLVTGVLLLGLMAYPVSIGPVYGLMLRGWLPASVFQLIYRPIIWLADQHPVIYDAIEDYTMMFLPY